MDRRAFLGKAGATAAAATVVTGAPAIATAAGKSLKWKMVTSWPRNFPGLGTGAAWLADAITEMSGGRLTVKIYGGGELVPALEVFDAVSRGTAEMGHSGAYYWKGKSPATQFFTAVPFGLTAIEMHAWLHFGGGMELWRKVYEPFNLIPFDAGNTGVQMGGWFNKEINSVADLKGLKMRIPGLGGEVLKRLGGTPVSLPGAELFTALQSGAIDATEWVGPYNDLAFGLYKAAKHYYYPGWHEPGPVLECMVNKDAWNSLPKDLQAIVTAATQAVSNRMLAEYTANNNQALQTLVTKHKVDLRRFPDDVLTSLRKTSDEVVAEVAAGDALTREVYESFRSFRDNVMAWHDVSERAYLNARAGQ